MKLDDVYKAWISVKKRQVKTSSLASYQQIYVKKLSPMLGCMEVGELSKKVIVPFMNDLMDNSGLSVKYCNDILIVLKMLIRFADEELDLEVHNITWKMVWPSKNKIAAQKLERYSPAEYKKIVDYVLANPSPRNLGILLTICSGMRIGEVCALQWKDIDFAKRSVFVCKTLIEVDNPYYDSEKPEKMKELGIHKVNFCVQMSTKREKNRYVPLNNNALELLTKHFDNAKYTEPDDYVISTINRKTSTPKNVSDTIKCIVKRGGLKTQEWNTHILRHTCASLYFKAGVDVWSVLVEEWCKQCLSLEERNRIYNAIVEALNN